MKYSDGGRSIRLVVVGFTVIELLVAVAVIGVLAALLLPALGSAKHSAQSTRCVSNLRQIGLALRLYADEADGRLPRAGVIGENGTVSNGWLPAIQEILGAHLKGGSTVFRCPADKVGAFKRHGSSYEWNGSLNGRILHRIGQDDPTERNGTFLMRDREAWHERGVRNAVYVDGHTGKESR